MYIGQSTKTPDLRLCACECVCFSLSYPTGLVGASMSIQSIGSHISVPRRRQILLVETDETDLCAFTIFSWYLDRTVPAALAGLIAYLTAR